MALALTGLVCTLSFGHACPKPKPPPKPPSAAAPAAPAAPKTPAASVASSPTTPPLAAGPPDSPEAWRAAGLAALEADRKPPDNRTHAKNLILFIGDGMGLSTVAAARILQGQAAGGPGEDGYLSFEAFPSVALAKTYNTDQQVAYAAGAVTAIVSGVKTRGAAVGMDQVPETGQCKEAVGHETRDLFEQAKASGRSVGLVTTSRVTLGAPAATYAHVTDQDWEVDSRMPPSAVDEGCRDIARQLVEFKGGLDLVLGGGRLAFLTTADADPIAPDRFGVRADGINLITRWSYRYPTGQYLYTASQLAAADRAWRAPSGARPGPVLGLFAPDDMAFAGDEGATGDQPSLTQMTVDAIHRLRASSEGYVLIVDAGNIDRAHHMGKAVLALDETVELSKAVAAAEQELGDQASETLVVVTADHGHTLTISGYPRRGSPIGGLALGPDGAPLRDATGRPYTTLSYANGPGALSVGAQETSPPLTVAAVSSAGYQQLAAAPMNAETHSGEDAPVYAKGPGSQWIHGVMEQNTLYFIMAEALGVLPRSPAGAPVPATAAALAPPSGPSP